MAMDWKRIRDPITHSVAITNSDSVDLTETSRALYTGSGGTAVILLEGDSAAVTFTSLAAGVVLPLRVKRVNATGTTPTDLVALY